MKTLISLTVMLAAIASAQAPGPTPEQKAAMEAAAKAALQQSRPQSGTVQPNAPAGEKQSIPIGQMMSILAMPPDKIVATIDGAKITAGDLQAILRTMPPNVQQQALNNRRQFLEQYGVMQRLSAEAEKLKLDQQSPWKESLANMRMQVLLQAEINQKIAEIQVPEDEQKKFYESNKERFVQAKVKAIYLPFSSDPVSKADDKGKKVLTEAEAKAKAESLLKQIRGGADFVKLVKENSGDAASAGKDGDFGTIKKADRMVPDAIRTAIFAAKAGEVTEPVRQANGYYLFRVEESGPPPFEQVRDNVANDIKNTRFQEWLNSVQKSVDIKEEAIEMTMEVQKPSSPAKAPGKK